MKTKAQKYGVVFFDGMEWQLTCIKMTLASAKKVAREYEGETHVVPVD